MSGFFPLGAPNLDEMGRCSKDIHVYTYCSFGVGHFWKPGIHSRQHRDYTQLLVGKHPFGKLFPVDLDHLSHPTGLICRFYACLKSCYQTDDAKPAA